MSDSEAVRSQNRRSDLRVPLMIRFPGRISQGLVREELVSSLDLVPTILEAVGADMPPELPGRSLWPLFGKGDKPWRRSLFTEYHGHYPPIYFPQRTVRDERYKLIVNLLQDRPNPVAKFCSRMDQPRHPPYVTFGELSTADETVRQAYETWYDAPPVELYDLKADPFEWQNRANDPTLIKIKEHLLGELRRWQQQTADPLADPEKLKRLTAEHDALETPYVRRPNFRWKYPEYLRPNGMDGQ